MCAVHCGSHPLQPAEVSLPPPVTIGAETPPRHCAERSSSAPRPDSCTPDNCRADSPGHAPGQAASSAELCDPPLWKSQCTSGHEPRSTDRAAGSPRERDATDDHAGRDASPSCHTGGTTGVHGLSPGNRALNRLSL